MSGSEESFRILPACTFQESISEPIKVKWNDIKYSDPNPKKWVLDSAYPADKTSQKALKCFKDQNPEKRLLLDQLNESVSNGSGAEKVDQKAVLGQKQPEKKRKRLLSSDEDDFASDTFVQSKVRKESSEKNKKSSEDFAKKVQKKSSEEEKENRPKEKQPEVPAKKPEVQKEREKEPEKAPEVVKEPEIVKVPAKIGHAIDPKINSVVQVDIGEAPKRSGICFEYAQTIGHRIGQLSEHSIDVQIKVQGRFKRFFFVV